MFRNLLRKNKEISREECIELLTSETRGILSVNGDDGYPYGMPMNHYYNADDGCIYFHCGKIGHRVDSLKTSDKVSFCVCERGREVEGDWALDVRSVIVFGRVAIIDDLSWVTRLPSASVRTMVRTLTGMPSTWQYRVNAPWDALSSLVQVFSNL